MERKEPNLGFELGSPNDLSFVYVNTDEKSIKIWRR